MAPDHRSQPRSKLQEWFPNTKLPVIISAPMLGVSNGTLAAQVSKAGGFGMVPGGADFTPGCANLRTLEGDLIAARAVLGLTEMTLTPAPIGVGFVTCHPSVSQFRRTALPMLEKYMPQAVWLFAPDDGSGASRAHPDIIAACHDHGFKVFVQVGTVAAAKEAASDGADVIVAQGVDAGGHQFAVGAGIVSLVPEIKAMLAAEVDGNEIVVVAAGGISDSSAVVAAVALGAEAAVMGTKFIVAREANTPEWRVKTVLETRDGGSSTVKSRFHDDIQGQKMWPMKYDGRAIIGQSYQDHSSGMALEENLQKFRTAKDAGENSRMVTWAGTGVGLVTESLPAADIVRNTREGAQQRLQALRYAFEDDGKDPREKKSFIKQLGKTLYDHK